jgi:formiminotetrahydrofolate cyclodeaminase
MSSSINLIYSDINHVLSNLDENLKSLKDEKQAENSSISLNYLAQTENTKKLLLGSSNDLKVVTRVYEQCSLLKS